MATYDEMFGSGTGKNYVKVQKEGEDFTGIYRGYEKVDDIDFTTKKQRYMVQEDEGGPWGPKLAGDFDEDDCFKSFPLKNVQLTLERDGKTWYWKLSGKAEEAFKSALKVAGGIEDGDTIGGLLVDTTKKPYTWKFKIVRQES